MGLRALSALLVIIVGLLIAIRLGRKTDDGTWSRWWPFWGLAAFLWVAVLGMSWTGWDAVIAPFLAASAYVIAGQRLKRIVPENATSLFVLLSLLMVVFRFGQAFPTLYDSLRRASLGLEVSTAERVSPRLVEVRRVLLDYLARVEDQEAEKIAKDFERLLAQPSAEGERAALESIRALAERRDNLRELLREIEQPGGAVSSTAPEVKTPAPQSASEPAASIQPPPAIRPAAPSHAAAAPVVSAPPAQRGLRLCFTGSQLVAQAVRDQISRASVDGSVHESTACDAPTDLAWRTLAVATSVRTSESSTYPGRFATSIDIAVKLSEGPKLMRSESLSSTASGASQQGAEQLAADRLRPRLSDVLARILSN